MSEQTATDGQFDAEAAQKAKSIVDSDSAPIFRKPGSGQQGPSEPVAEVAQRYMDREHELARKQNEIPQARIDALKARAAAVENNERLAQAFLEEAQILETTPDRATPLREANRTEANAHLERNRPVYESMAIEDATAAGHDVSFGGQHYPAQTPEQQK